MKLQYAQYIKVTLVIAYYHSWLVKLLPHFIDAAKAYSWQTSCKHAKCAHNEFMEMQATMLVIRQDMEIKPRIRKCTQKHKSYEECY